MNRLRLATKEEVNEIRSTADITPDSVVLALETQVGVCTAVIRPVVEVDPVDFPEGFSDRFKAIFMRDIETYLAAKGVSSYYFNIHNSPEMANWREVSETWGAKPISTEPEIRYKKEL